MDEASNFKCKECGKVFDYTQVEADFERGSHTVNPPVQASFPHKHKDCGGEVEIVA